MPGRRPSSRINVLSGAGNLTADRSWSWAPRRRLPEASEHASEAAHAAHRRAHLALLELFRLALGLGDGRRDEVLQHLDVLWVYDAPVDPYGDDAAVPLRCRRDHTGSRAALDRQLGEALLSLRHLALGLLGLLHELLDVHIGSPRSSRARPLSRRQR